MRCFCGTSPRQADSTSGKNALRTTHDNCLGFARGLACAPSADHPAGGGVASGARERSQQRAVAGDRLCHAACRALDIHPDQPQGGAGCPYGCRGGVCLGAENPARLRQASTAGGMGRGSLVHAIPGRRLGHLCIGDGDARLRAGDLLADQPACGRSAPSPQPRKLRRPIPGTSSAWSSPS